MGYYPSTELRLYLFCPLKVPGGADVRHRRAEQTCVVNSAHFLARGAGVGPHSG